MASRLELQKELENILGNRNVYFQPPETIKISYPAVVYSIEDLPVRHADNGVYSLRRKYSVTYIDKNPDNENTAKIAMMPACRFNQFYRSENLNHWNFSLYY